MARRRPAARALRGTKTLTHAFFDAADTIPLDRRPAVVKAALASIRDELKIARDKARETKTKVKAGTTRAAPAAKTVAAKGSLRRTAVAQRVASPEMS